MKQVLMMVACVLGMSALGETINLSDRPSARGLRPWGNVEDGVLVIDTLASPKVWNPAFRTDERFFEAGKTYEITFRCEIEETVDEGYLLLLMRPAFETDHQRDIANMEVYETPKPDGVVRFRIKMPPNGEKSRQAFQIHTFRGVRARVWELGIRALSREEVSVEGVHVLCAGEGMAAAEGEPTGCPEFEVDLPRAPKVVYDVTEYGVREENEDNSAALQELFWLARKTRPAKIVFPKGVYRMGDGADLLFDTTFDVEVDGQGSTLLFRKTKGKLFSIHHSERVAVRNLTIDWDWAVDPLASFVEVVARDKFSLSVDLRFVDYEDFPRKDVRVADLSEVEKSTRYMPPGGGHHLSFEFFKGRGAPEKKEWVAPNVLRLYMNMSQYEVCQEGRLFLMRHYVYDMNAFHLINNKHTTFENVHVVSCPGMGFLASGVQEYWQILHCSVHPAEGSKRGIAATADAIHAGSSRGHIKIVDTLLGGGGDDTLNLHDGSVYAVRLDAHRVLTLNHNNLPGNYFWKGHAVEFREEDFAPTGFTGKLAEVKRIDAGRGKYELVFEEEVPEPVGRGFVLYNRNYGTRNVLVKGCTFDQFPRGFLLMADNVTVEDCHFHLGKAGGIKIESGYTMKVWSEGYGASNVVIRGNLFETVNQMGRYDYEGRPDIYISTYRVVDPSMDKARYPLLHDSLIEKNRFRGTTGVPLYIASAGRVTVRNNTFDLRTPSPIPEATRGAIVMDSATDVTLEGNVWILPPEDSEIAAKASVFYDPESTVNLHLKANRIER